MRIETIGRATDRITSIYALCEADGMRPRYVGKTVQYIHERHKAHIRAAKAGGKLPVNYWLRKQITEGKWLAIKLLEYVPAHADWAARERFWITKYRDEGHNLLNLTDGGEGLAGHVFTAEHREKIASSIRTGAYFDCETCGAAFWRKQTEIKKGNCRFCSRHCYSRSLKGKAKPVPRSATERGIVAAAKKRRAQTHCLRGHPLSGDNLYLNPRGIRVCKQCRRIHKKRARSNG